MATAFDGLGMQFMGKERQHMASGPFGDLAKMIAPGALAYGLYKSGAVDSLNSAFNPKEALMGYMKGQGVAPPQMSGTTNDMLAKDSKGGGGGDILAAVAPQLIKMYFGLG